MSKSIFHGFVIFIYLIGKRSTRSFADWKSGDRRKTENMARRP